MKISSLLIARKFGFIFLLTLGIAAQAADVKVLSAVPMRAVMEDLGPKSGRASGHKLAIIFSNFGTIVKRVQGGETPDVVIIPRQGIDGYLIEAKATAGNVTDIARVGVGVAVRKGAPKPDISSPGAFKRALLAAKSITYGNPATGSASGAILSRCSIALESPTR